MNKREAKIEGLRYAARVVASELPDSYTPEERRKIYPELEKLAEHLHRRADRLEQATRKGTAH